MSTAVLFNLFSEAHGTLGGLLRPEVLKFEAEGWLRGGVLGGRSASPLPTS